VIAGIAFVVGRSRTVTPVRQPPVPVQQVQPIKVRRLIPERPERRPSAPEQRGQAR
jgi:hypothetical protein